MWEEVKGMWGSMGRCEKRCEKCVGVGRGEKCGQRWGVWKDVGRGLGSVKKCGER